MLTQHNYTQSWKNFASTLDANQIFSDQTDERKFINDVHTFFGMLNFVFVVDRVNLIYTSNAQTIYLPESET